MPVSGSAAGGSQPCCRRLSLAYRHTNIGALRHASPVHDTLHGAGGFVSLELLGKCGIVTSGFPIGAKPYLLLFLRLRRPREIATRKY